MDKRFLIIITLLILLSSCGMASALKETRITLNTADQTSPSMYDKYITWTDTRNGGTDIYLQNMGNKVQTRVTKSGKAGDSCVAVNRIVYDDYRNGNYDIYMYDISTKKETRITTNTANQTNPSVYGNKIVWDDTRAKPGPGVYMLDLSTKKETSIVKT